jgi:meso-butanediol dehydrogenase/(S,S)-butanediol dehydrogenase/diacetyl reductase
LANFSSIAGKAGCAWITHESAPRFAIIRFAQTPAKNLTRDHMIVNADCPGVVGSQMWKMRAKEFALPGESEQHIYRRNVGVRIPQGDLQTEEDTAEAVMFLAVSDHMTDQVIKVDGGA